MSFLSDIFHVLRSLKKQYFSWSRVPDAVWPMKGLWKLNRMKELNRMKRVVYLKPLASTVKPIEAG